MAQQLKIIKFLTIPDTNPWNKIFCMCGACGHAVALREVEEHAKKLHEADGVDIFENASDANA